MENGSSSGNYEKGRERKGKERKKGAIMRSDLGELERQDASSFAFLTRKPGKCVRRRAETHGRIKKGRRYRKGKGTNGRKDALRLIN